MQQSLAIEWEHWMTRRPRAERRAYPVDPSALASESLEPLREQSADERVLTIRDVHWRAPGFILSVPALRVNIDAVDAWWIVGGQGLEHDEPHTHLSS